MPCIICFINVHVWLAASKIEGVAVSENNNVIYVTDSLKHAILHVSDNGKVVTRYLLGVKELPKAITLDDVKG